MSASAGAAANPAAAVAAARQEANNRISGYSRVLAGIEQAIRSGEATRAGQACFVVEGALHGMPPKSDLLSSRGKY
jgi:hypothetical protein